ncbi:MAG: 23S rRNA (pseudouridine(1915)-N(3))-methyltransferase RlmH, partial [Candidatus Saccharimonadales bacterium]
DHIILLDERGKLYDSPFLSGLFVGPLEQSKRVVVIIGGAYGVHKSVHTRANTIWSLSPAVFPHQLVRLVLIEQLYRSQAIAEGSPYHHE